jgi:hypothetical protein
MLSNKHSRQSNQVDDCCRENNLKVARVSLNGGLVMSQDCAVYPPPAPPPGAVEQGTEQHHVYVAG